MIRFYSLFVTDDELLASPYVRRFNVLHDLTLNRGKTETVNFLLQTTITPEQIKELKVIYDPLSIDISNIDVRPFKHQTLVTVDLAPKELGSVRIGFSVPQSKPLHKTNLRKVDSPLTSVPCIKLGDRRRIERRRQPVT